MLKVAPINEPATEKELSRILEQVSGAIEVSEVARDWRAFMSELERFYKEFTGQLNMVLAEAVHSQQNGKKSILS